ncbi:hypothetical protein [Arthrobacter sp. RCC_34]|uniref:hypothetical protein n=1 Tax=Arthrobacter sp. RCC_34 TaxID=3239230 RepID=UPI0035235681
MGTSRALPLFTGAAIAALALTTSACAPPGPEAVGGAPLQSLRLATTGVEQLSGMEASLTTTLELNDDGCVVSRDGNQDTVLAWPAGYSVQRKNGSFIVKDASGREVASSGTRVSLGGGGTSPDGHWDTHGCSGQAYWAVGAITVVQ